jgi:hypothetical protein
LRLVGCLITRLPKPDTKPDCRGELMTQLWQAEIISPHKPEANTSYNISSNFDAYWSLAL